MHEVAETRPSAFAHLVLTTAGFTKICDRRELGIDRASPEPAIVQIAYSTFSIFLATELDVDVSNEMIAKIVANVHLLNLSVFVFQLNENVFEEVVVVLLHFLVRHICDQMRSVGRLCGILRVHVQVLEQACLREGWFVVDTRASITMTASTDFEIEGAIYFVFLGSENRCKMLSHR